MYQSFYGLTDKPFQLNPDPSFYFGSREHRRAMAYLEYGLHQNEGFIVVTGEVGTGKTTLIRSLLSKLDPHQVVAAQLVSTQLDAEDTLRMVCAAFGLPAKDIEKSDALVSLEGFLRSVAKDGRRALLIIDEAQNLAPRAVEELRMLSNFQVGTNALVQSFLVGQPEFRQTMCSPHMQQLRQRVIASCHISPLGSEDTRAYIEHRLTHAGWKNDPTISADAFEAIFRFSGGTPRRINTLCDRLLLSGFLNESHEITESDVDTVANELREETFSADRSSPGQTNGPQPAGTHPSPDAPVPHLSCEKSEITDSTTESGLRLLGGLQLDSMLERVGRLERSSEVMISLLQQLLIVASRDTSINGRSNSSAQLSDEGASENTSNEDLTSESNTVILNDPNRYLDAEERKESAG
jgi:putative secretion ATPase (PEP-CTERM system associated)